jgi:prepilin-type N-terminal cleavage/methylation domain-containing protein
MRDRNKKIGNSGFSLVEMLVVVAIMGLVTTAIFSLFQNVQNTGYTQEEVVDLQQNLRVAMDTLTKDIQMAGFLVPPTTMAITTAPASLAAGNTLVLQTATTSLDVARLDGDVTVAVADTAKEFTLASSEMVGLFAANDKVRLVRSPDHGQKIDALFTVDSVDSSTRKITLSGFGANTADYQEVDLLVKTGDAGHPANLTYALDAANNELERTASDGGGAQVVADNITAVDFVYRLENGTETNAPTSLGDIRGVRVTLTGTAFDLTNKGTKTRILTKLITLKNDM